MEPSAKSQGANIANEAELDENNPDVGFSGIGRLTVDCLVYRPLLQLLVHKRPESN